MLLPPTRAASGRVRHNGNKQQQDHSLNSNSTAHHWGRKRELRPRRALPNLRLRVNCHTEFLLQQHLEACPLRLSRLLHVGAPFPGPFQTRSTATGAVITVARSRPFPFRPRHRQFPVDTFPRFSHRHRQLRPRHSVIASCKLPCRLRSPLTQQPLPRSRTRSAAAVVILRPQRYARRRRAERRAAAFSSIAAAPSSAKFLEPAASLAVAEAPLLAMY